MPIVEIRRPTIKDNNKLNQFFTDVIINTFVREGLSELIDDIQTEIETKKKYLLADLESNGENRYFLIALTDKKIIGSIEFGPASELINRCSGGALEDLVEVGTVYVHPDYQRQGIGNLLLNKMITTLKNRGIEEFCLDSGYKNSQKIWLGKFGEPEYLLPDYWGQGNDHMIWRIQVNH